MSVPGGGGSMASRPGSPQRVRRRHSIAIILGFLPISLGIVPTGANYAYAVAPSKDAPRAQGEPAPNIILGEVAAVSGANVVVGAPLYGATGQAFVFANTGASWPQVADLHGVGAQGGFKFGSSVAISGSTIVVGADSADQGAGRAFVFSKYGTRWRQTAELRGRDTSPEDFFGTSVSVSGSEIVVGAPQHEGGRAYIFTVIAGRWHQSAELKARDNTNHDRFGSSVSLTGSQVVIGAPQHESGRAYVFADESGGWGQVAELRGAAVATMFGWSVATSETTVVVGALQLAGTGHAYVFDKTGSGWRMVADLVGRQSAPGAWVGSSVAISGSTVAVGVEGEASGAGRVYVFARAGYRYTQSAELGPVAVGECQLR